MPNTSRPVCEMAVLLLGFGLSQYNILKNINGHAIATVLSDSNDIFRTKLSFDHHHVNLEKDEDNVLDVLMELGGDKADHQLIVPATDQEVLFLDRHRSILSKSFYLCIPESNALRAVSDKFLLQDALHKYRINYPRSFLITRSSLDEDLSEISFPCLLKPVFSNEWKTSQATKLLGGQKAIIVENSVQLSEVYKKVSSISKQVIAQEIIRQKDYENYSFCSYSDSQGNILHSFVTQKLIQYPDKFGTALLCQTVDNPRITEYGTKVVKALGIDGIAETEIIVDAETDELFVIEVNPRHWMQHRLSTRLGVNYTLLDIYYRLGMDDQVQACLNAQRNSKHAIWIDDIGYLIYAGKHFFHPGKCFFKELLFKTREYSLFSFQDWRPFWHTLKSKFSRIQ